MKRRERTTRQAPGRAEPRGLRFAPRSGRRIHRGAVARAEQFPYRKRRALLSAGELAFYRVLVAVVRDRWTINVKARLADVIWCPPSRWHTPAGARIAQKHLDFVLYERTTTAVLLAIELDDRSHARRDRKARDDFVDDVLHACGVVLVRVKAAATYDRDTLKTRIEAAAARATGAVRKARGFAWGGARGGWWEDA